jgi:hypothetical protein
MNASVLSQELCQQASQINRVFEQGPRLLSSISGEELRPSLAEDLGKIIDKMIPWAHVPERHYRETWERIRSGQITDCHGAGESLFHFWDLVIHELWYLHNWASILHKCGLTIPNFDRLDAALKQTKQKRDEGHRGWPWAIADADQGRAIPVEEILRELQGASQ